MRTTLDIDDDILEIARGMAAHRRQSLGKVMSEMFRKNLQVSGTQKFRNGVEVIQRPGKATPVTLEIVNQLRDEGP
jgi:hypothetical protein